MPNLSVTGFLLLKVGDKTFKLDGSVGKNIDVAYHADYTSALSVGTFTGVVGQLCSTIGIDDTFSGELNGIIADLQDVPGVGALAAQLRDAQMKITDLVLKLITTEEPAGSGKFFKLTEFQFGFFVDFVGLEFAGVDVDGFGVKLKYGPTKTAVVLRPRP